MGESPSPARERPWGTADDSPVALEAVAYGLTERHFTKQAQRPDHLSEVDLVAMDPSLRSLLFTDGTVTRTLEVLALSPISVEVVRQHESVATDEVADNLEVPSGTSAILRHVVIGVESHATPVIWAESHILPNRLPPDFLGVLNHSPDGIGESLQEVRLESWREMLWFGLDSSPSWREADGGVPSEVLRRVYRVITGGRPAILISESLAVELRSGAYHLSAE